jgi:predicted DNA-binding transcriptional regulator YafY
VATIKPQFPGRSRRMNELLARLRQEDYPSPKVLAELLGTCAKTIQRDLMEMRDQLRWPVQYDRARKGWHVTEKGFYLPLAFASKEDLQAIMVLGELISQYGDTPLGQSMQSAFARVLELFKGEDRDSERVRGFSRRVCFVGAPSARFSHKIWKEIITALQTDERLEIEYRKGGSGEAAWRKFDPYGLIIRNREWFLHGYCHTRKCALTLFIPYIKQVRLLSEVFFELPVGFDLSAYTRAGLMGLQAGTEPSRKVVLRFSPDSAGAAESAPFMADQKIEREPSGNLRVTFKTNALFQLRRELMRWAADVEVLEPAELRNEIKEAVEEMRDLYK